MEPQSGGRGLFLNRPAGGTLDANPVFPLRPPLVTSHANREHSASLQRTDAVKWFKSGSHEQLFFHSEVPSVFVQRGAVCLQCAGSGHVGVDEVKSTLYTLRDWFLWKQSVATRVNENSRPLLSVLSASLEAAAHTTCGVSFPCYCGMVLL